MKALSLSRLGWLIAGTTFLGVSPPAQAQNEPEELVVTGRYERVPSDVQSLSQTVSYADLDLSTDTGKRELRRRLNLTARFLCEKLAQPTPMTATANSTCQEAAVRDAMQRVGTIEANFAPRGTAWVAGPAWKAPYPEEWVKDYKD